MDNKTVEPAGDPLATPGARRGWVDIAVWVGVCVALVGVAWALAAWIGAVAGGVPDALRRLNSLEIRVDLPAERDAPPPSETPAPVDEQAAAPASPPPPGAVPPHWVRQPRAEYPQEALRRGVTAGSVSIRCQVAADGRLRDCAADEESPAGVGFAEAAILSLRDARVAVHDADGQARGPEISFTMRFRLE